MTDQIRSLTTKEHSIGDLNALYTDGDSCDQAIFSEMRSNLLLVSGDHYQKRQSYFYKRIRDSKELNQEQKMRLTKNHTQKIANAYSNNILSTDPNVGFEPKNEGDMHQQKVADLNHFLWRDGFSKYSLDDFFDDACDEFVQIGEAIVKIFFDPSTGPIVAYEHKLDVEGQPVFDETGGAVPDEEKPIRKGAFVFEEVFGFNLLRPSKCKDIKKAEWLCIRKMVNKKDLKAQFANLGDSISTMISNSNDDTYTVFDGASAGYRDTKDQTMVREYYFRPCVDYPNGYYFITTIDGILSKGELPGGIFPIIVQPFNKIPTTPRGRSPVKTMRPYQAEINRSASKIAEHQVTLGDDKLLIQNGTKVSAGAALPGVRALNFTGMEPKILAGRDGSQYLQYMLSQIDEMYKVMNVFESEQDATGQLDPYVLLFRSAHQKKKFQRYIRRFEKFMIEVVKTYLRLAKVHMSDEDLINAIGKKEQINVPELRQASDILFDIKVVAQSDDIETKMGKQLVMNHVLQYVGPQMKPEDIGKVMRNMPYADMDESFDDLTMSYDSVNNEILALDRGEQPPVHEVDDHAYSAKRLLARMRKPDFEFLSEQIKKNYQGKLMVHQQIDAFQKMQIQRAQQGFIPTGGYLVKCDFYVTVPGSEGMGTASKTQRAALPYQAVEWLIKQLEAQGQGQKELAGMDQSLQAMYADTSLSPQGRAAVGPTPRENLAQVMPG